MILRQPHLLWLLLPLGAVALLGAWRGRARGGVLLLRSVILAALVAAIADPIRPGTAPPPPLVVLVDASASVDPARRDAAWEAAHELAQEHGAKQTVLAAFGGDAVVTADGQLPAVDPNASDIPRALRFAGDLLGRDAAGVEGRHVVLISDGASTVAGADIAAAELRRAGVIVDVLPLPADERLDARVVEIGVPASLREGQTYRGEIVVAATAPTTATLRVAEDDEPPSEQTLTLEQGRNVVPFAGTGGRSGLHRARAGRPRRAGPGDYRSGWDRPGGAAHRR